jgi:hypothetical protein
VDLAGLATGLRWPRTTRSGHGDREMLDNNVQVSYVAGHGREQCKWTVAHFWLLVLSLQ